jgi:hypothetical protein
MRKVKNYLVAQVAQVVASFRVQSDAKQSLKIEAKRKRR